MCMSISVTLYYVHLPLFFFLMIRRPPRSTLFPTRRSSDLPPPPVHRPPHQRAPRVPDPPRACLPRHHQGRAARSEEHTSELQSQFHLVCRLLLEKKKKLKNFIF